MGPSSNSRYSRYLRYWFSTAERRPGAQVPAEQPEGLARYLPRAMVLDERCIERTPESGGIHIITNVLSQGND